MRIPALFAAIALGTFNPAIQRAAASSTAQSANSGLATVHQSSDANVQRRIDAKKLSSARSPSPHVAPHPPTTRSSPAVSSHAAERTAVLGRTGPNRGHFTPYNFNPGAAPGSSGSAVGRHASVTRGLGGRTEYDAKKGAIVGGAAMGRKR